MNKRNMKLTKIVSLAAMLLPLAYSGSAVAGKNDNNGQKGSIVLTSICYIETVPYTGPDGAVVPAPHLRVETAIADTSTNPGDATLDGLTAQALQKFGGGCKDASCYQNIGDPDIAYPVLAGDPPTASATSRIPLCVSAMGNATLDPDARAVNALITVNITDDHNNKAYGFTARCSDDPDTYYVDEVAELNVWKKGLCQ